MAATGVQELNAPIFEAAAMENMDVVFAKVNTDEQQDIAASFDIKSNPI